MNNVIVGNNSGNDLTTEENYVILANDMSAQDVKEKVKPGMIYLGEKVCIQRDWLSEKCPLRDEELLKKWSTVQLT